VEKNSKDMVKSADTNQWNKTIQRAQKQRSEGSAICKLKYKEGGINKDSEVEREAFRSDRTTAYY